jgi:competence protein ComGC
MADRRRIEAFTRKELIVVIVVLVVLGLMLPPAIERQKQKSRSIACICKLLNLWTAYRIWSNDHGDHFPANTPITNGGWSDLLYRTNASTYCWTNYVTMANELGQSPFILLCPDDERTTVSTFSELSNTNISYFVGVDANDTYPQAILGGDRNLGPGTTPDPEYGFSPADGRGNDVVINGPVCWSLKMHSRRNNAGAGNIMLGDGSAQQVTSGNLNANWLKPASETAAAHDKATNSPGMRLIFP